MCAIFMEWERGCQVDRSIRGTCPDPGSCRQLRQVTASIHPLPHQSCQSVPFAQAISIALYKWMRSRRGDEVHCQMRDQ